MCGKGEVDTGYWCENLKEKGHLESLSVVESIILKHILNKSAVMARTGLVSFRMRTSCKLL